MSNNENQKVVIKPGFPRSQPILVIWNSRTNMYVTVHRCVLYSLWFRTDVCKKARNTKWFAYSHPSQVN